MYARRRPSFDSTRRACFVDRLRNSAAEPTFQPCRSSFFRFAFFIVIPPRMVFWSPVLKLRICQHGHITKQRPTALARDMLATTLKYCKTRQLSSWHKSPSPPPKSKPSSMRCWCGRCPRTALPRRWPRRWRRSRALWPFNVVPFPTGGNIWFFILRQT